MIIADRLAQVRL